MKLNASLAMSFEKFNENVSLVLGLRCGRAGDGGFGNRIFREIFLIESYETCTFRITQHKVYINEMLNAFLTVSFQKFNEMYKSPRIASQIPRGGGRVKLTPVWNQSDSTFC